MRRIVRSVGRSALARSFNWDVVIRLALVPAVSYVLIGAATATSRRAAREAALTALGASALFGR